MSKLKESFLAFKNNPSFTVKEQLGYSGGIFGNAMGQDCVYTYSSKFNRDYQMIAPDRLTLMENVSTIFSFIVPPIAGPILDRPTPLGKRSTAKTILRYTPIPFALTSLLLFVVPSSNALTNLIWAFTLTILFETVDAFFDMAMTTISLRMTTNANDRKNFYTISSLASTLGSMLPGWLLPIVVGKFSDANQKQWAYFFVALFFCILGVTVMQAPYYTLNEKVGLTPHAGEEKIKWDREKLSAILHNKPFMIAMIASIFETIRKVAYDLLPDLYGETFDKLGMKAIIDMISGALSYVGLFLVPIIGTKVSARTMLVGGHFYSAAFYSAIALLGVKFNLSRVRKLKWVVGVLIGLSGMPNSGMDASRKIIVGDSTDYMEWYSEKYLGEPIRSDGLLVAVQSIVGRLNTLIRVNIKNLSLVAIGYKEGKKDASGKAIPMVQSQSTLKGIYFVVALCGLIGNLLPGIMYLFDRFTGTRREQILIELTEMRRFRADAEGVNETPDDSNAALRNSDKEETEAAQ
ncbi:MAG: MFS transporter [Clostridia bacterium]|nr:MFS transporter [Clostridia bacterium]